MYRLRISSPPFCVEEFGRVRPDNAEGIAS